MQTRNLLWNIRYQCIDISSLCDDAHLQQPVMEINEGRANANKLLVRFVREAVASYEARLASWEGGNMRNAIPREAHAVITIPAENEEDGRTTRTNVFFSSNAR